MNPSEVESGPVLVVHGGAGRLSSEQDRAAYQEGVMGALTAGAKHLGQSAADAACAAVAWLESESITNAGRGAALAADGSAILDAGFMDGSSRRYGGVTGVRRCMHPVDLARRLAEEGDYGRLVAAPDSDGLTEELSVPGCAPEDLVTERARGLYEQRSEQERPSDAGPWLDTVGAVALDANGGLAAAVSTGGMSHKRPGRIGDSPVVGGGYWADDRQAACVTTGVGEVLMREGTARRCVQLYADSTGQGDPQAAAVAAAATALHELSDYEGDQRGNSGLILVTAQGVVVLDHNSHEMSGGWIRPGGVPEVGAFWRA